MEFKLPKCHFDSRKWFFIMIMKTFIFLFCTTVFSFNTNTTWAQEKVLIDTDKEVTVDEVFQIIMHQTEFSFLYPENMFKDMPKVQLKKGEIEVEELLSKSLSIHAFNFDLKDNNVIHIRRIPAPPQEITITGTVVDDNDIPIPGVTILIKGTKRGTSTDFEGNYSIKVPNSNSVLMFSSLGFDTKEISVGEQSTTYVILEENVSALDEVTINAGYYSTSEKLKTGNISKITSEEISKTPVSNPIGALQGRIPGMEITQSSGNPGASFEVEIRGRTQLDRINGASDEPLYIIDNVPLASGNENLNQLPSAISGASLDSGLSPLYSLNPADIESIEILKDADATAIYGSRGASGVVLITTKKGEKGKTKFDINVSNGVSVAPLPDVLSTKEYVAMRKEALLNDGLDLDELANSSSLSDRNMVYDLVQYDTLRDNNLAKQLIGGTARTTNVQASLSGGSESTQFVVGAGYHKETNVVPGDFPNERFSGRFKLTNTTPNKKFTSTFTASYTSMLNTSTSSDLTSRVLSFAPNYKLYEENGDLAWNEGEYKSDNPLAYTLRKYEAKTSNLNTNTMLSYKIIPGLTLKSSIGYNLITTDENTVTPSTFVNPLDRTGADGNYRFGHRTFKSLIIEPQLEYSKSIGKGSLNTLIGGSFQSQENEGYTIFIRGYENDNQIGNLDVVTPDMLNSPPSGTFSKYRYAALFGRINFNYDNKYLINLTGRRDGSSRFGPDYRFSNFGAIGAAWIFSDETFLKDISIISFAKLRASYGVTGNDKIGEYKYQDVYDSGSFSGYDGDPILTPASLFNSTLHWERNVKTEVTLDLNFFKDLLQFSGSWYRNNSSDPLVNYPLPVMTGYNNVVNNLNGVIIQNQGLELQLTSINIESKDFRWSTNFNITIPSNKLLEYPDFDESSYTGQYAIGESLNTIIAANMIGVDPETGLYSVEDYNDNGVLDSSARDGDLRSQLNTDPDFYGGLQNSISYKNVNLSFLFQFRKKMGMNWYASNTGLTDPVGAVGSNYPNVVLDRWQNPGDNASFQKFTTMASFLDITDLNGGHLPATLSDFTYSDVSFLRLKNVALSFDLPERAIEELGLSNLRLYAQGHNLLTFTPYKAGDPETPTLRMLPPLRTVVMGVQISF